MEINLNIRSGKEDVDAYISDLEQYILSWEASNIKKLLTACDDLSGVVAEDVTLISKGTPNPKLKILSEDKSDLYDKFIDLMGKIKNFKAASDILEEIKPKVIQLNSKEPESAEKVKPVRRI